MTSKSATTTWQESPNDVIMLVNRSANNYILELPTGRCRLDAHRTIRTLRSITNVEQVKRLVEQGELVIE